MQLETMRTGPSGCPPQARPICIATATASLWRPRDGQRMLRRSMTVAPAPAFSVTLLALAGFLSGMGIRATDALLPVIAADFRISVAAAGITVAAFTLPYGLMQIVFGPLGDRFGKMRVIACALAAYAVATLACAAAGSLSQLVVLRAFAGGAAGGLIPLGMAHIGDMVPYEHRQATIGRFLTGMVMAQLLSGPLGGIFGDTLGWRGLFVLLGATALLAAFVLLRSARAPAAVPQGGGFGLIRFVELFRRPEGRLVTLSAFVDGFLLFGSFAYLGAYLREAFGLPYTQVGLILAAFGLGSLVYTRLAGPMVRALGEARLLLAGGLVLTACLAATVLAPDWRWVVPAQFGLGLGFFMFHGVLQARATEAMPEARATAVSGFAMMLFLGQAAGALLIGLAITQAGWQAAYLAWAAGILALSLALRGLLGRRA